MTKQLGNPSKYGLENHHLRNLKAVYWNLFPPDLIEHIIRRDEGVLANNGAVVVNTGQFTGRSPNDKYIVNHGHAEDEHIWWGAINHSISPPQFQRIHQELLAYLQGREVFVQDMLAGAHPQNQIPIRIITESAWHSLFAWDLFLRVPRESFPEHVPLFTLIHAPGFTVDPQEHGINSNIFILIDLEEHLILIGGTSYAGEIKKSIFTIMNYLMPGRGVLPMHCSANVGEKGDVALFFGLSGTGKTTLSSEADRRLIGDDEHGWAEEGVFNFEGGCYAKTIHLRSQLEPIIWEATRRFGTVLENVVVDPASRCLDFDDGHLTENTRAAYPLEYVPGRVVEGRAGHPENIFLLTADAFGVLPPLARLTTEQAMYYFLSGYTSKLAGTEKGLGAEPQATFSTCFGAPFLPLHPSVYADLLRKKINQHHVKVWLLNTGWTGGAYGVGQRIPLPYTRAMVKAVLNHQLDGVPTQIDPFFGLAVPMQCPGVPETLFEPCRAWSDSDAYQQQTRGLISSFIRNFQQFSEAVSPGVLAAGPRLE